MTGPFTAPRGMVAAPPFAPPFPPAPPRSQEEPSAASVAGTALCSEAISSAARQSGPSAARVWVSFEIPPARKMAKQAARIPTQSSAVRQYEHALAARVDDVVLAVPQPILNGGRNACVRFALGGCRAVEWSCTGRTGEIRGR